MKESKDTSLKGYNYWKKSLYSSFVLGAIFVGGQYISTVHANADTTQNSNQSNQVQITFINANDHSEALPSTISGYVGQSSNLISTKTKLQDLGYDVSNIPDTYTPNTSNTEDNQDANTFYVNPIGATNKPNNLNGKNKLIFQIRDQNNNYIESKYSSTDSSEYDLNPNSNADYAKIIGDLNQEQDKFRLYGSSSNANTYNSQSTNTNGDNIAELHNGDNIFTISVTAPTHSLTINYVNKHNVTVFKTIRQVTDYGHTNFYSDSNYFSDGQISINPGQPYVANNQESATINVTTADTFNVPSNPNDVSTYNYDYSGPTVSSVSDANGSQNPSQNAYYTTVNIVGSDNKNIVSLILGSNDSQFVSTNDLGPDDNDYDSLVDFDNVTDMPSFLDLTKGPYTFHSTDTLSGLQASSASAKSQAAAEQQASSSAQSSQSNQLQQVALQSSASQPAVESAKSSAVVSSASQPSIEQAKSSAQPSSVPAEQPAAPAVQSHSSSDPVASTSKSTPAPEQKQTPAPAPKPVVKPAPQPAKPAAKAKPSKTQFKAIAKSYKQSKHAVKADTAKLRALKKKMKKHATKKQKAAYKALQTKLAAAKKAVKSYKSQEGKLTKYFKEVAVINRDNKQIKSLTAQMKKLKKKHSKANKKKAAKVQKALKKANNSLKAATKFVKKYK
ncbi:hypothetical protein [Apilactobacillus kunkeei]|uniref:Uncharacterized protein n=1 Tax=Apilactobacillus kunkeei TaxID=148814 RepID=A0A0M9DG73_9LACO|nr:hypothetical protein [Apilactobacillus kunkeei]KOY79760.1 hypothetical protein RZ72_06560 [Apilactobacillus kunkeei]